MASIEEMTAAVKAHALANYEAGGWDVIVECWEDDEITDHIQSAGVQTEEDAITLFKPLVSVWAERQADADYYRREALGTMFSPEEW